MEDPSKITFKQPLILYFKPAFKPFEKSNFQILASITNLKQFWQVFNNIHFQNYLSAGSFFLSCKETPLWNDNGATFSFIVSFITTNNQQQQQKNFDEKMNIPWLDLALAFISLILNDPEIVNKVEGISITAKIKSFNLKFGITSPENNENLITSFKTNLPSYFGDYKFMENNERKKQQLLPPPIHFTRPPRSTKFSKKNKRKKTTTTITN
jgi:hypothetical protein